MSNAVLLTASQNDVDAASKAAPMLASSKVEGTAASKPASAALDDTEMKKVLEECKRLQTEMSKLQEENRQLKVTSGDRRHKGVKL